MGRAGFEPAVFLCNGFTARRNRHYTYLPMEIGECGDSPKNDTYYWQIDNLLLNAYQAASKLGIQ